jgi:hypothetical protein
MDRADASDLPACQSDVYHLHLALFRNRYYRYTTRRTMYGGRRFGYHAVSSTDTTVCQFRDEPLPLVLYVPVFLRRLQPSPSGMA